MPFLDDLGIEREFLVPSPPIGFGGALNTGNFEWRGPGGITIEDDPSLGAAQAYVGADDPTRMHRAFGKNMHPPKSTEIHEMGHVAQFEKGLEDAGTILDSRLASGELSHSKKGGMQAEIGNEATGRLTPEQEGVKWLIEKAMAGDKDAELYLRNNKRAVEQAEKFSNKGAEPTKGVIGFLKQLLNRDSRFETKTAPGIAGMIRG